ncbi:hypothetical protein [Streptacidiphilus fuscans]|uniref:Uncharacterized protein n=1 Tax=Streptacidiphilus fuscans TaxID=2789292 RepID=A0A931FDR1_9ACTN|nr:hypothetical protein [Streptacidiphilus fuscans]MBF9068405.1 hypothetical protein [Streptacidiphilus fuscans]
MTDVDSGLSATRALRASVGLTVLAAVLLACGAAVQATGSLQGPSANGGGSVTRPTTTARPVHPVPTFPIPTHPAPPPTCVAAGPVLTGCGGGGLWPRRDR